MPDINTSNIYKPEYLPPTPPSVTVDDNIQDDTGSIHYTADSDTDSDSDCDCDIDCDIDNDLRLAEELFGEDCPPTTPSYYNDTDPDPSQIDVPEYVLMDNPKFEPDAVDKITDSDSDSDTDADKISQRNTDTSANQVNTEREKKLLELEQKKPEVCEALNLYLATNKSLKLDDSVKEITTENIDEVLSKNYDKIIKNIMNNSSSSRANRTELVEMVTNYMFDAADAKGIYTTDLREKMATALEKENKKVIGFYNEKSTVDLMDTLDSRIKENDSKIDCANGKLDRNYSQGGTGDCWLVASIYSILNTPNGKELLEKNLNVLDNGDVEVTLGGVNKTYTVSYEELNGKDELSKGDMDIRAIEIAVEKYMYENMNDTIEGDNDATAYKILIGKDDSGFLHGRNGEKWFKKIDSKYFEKIKDPNCACTVSTHGKESRAAQLTNGNTVENYLTSNHAYSVVDADDENVYLVNPWDTSKMIQMSKNDFVSYFNSFGYVDLN